MRTTIEPRTWRKPRVAVTSAEAEEVFQNVFVRAYATSLDRALRRNINFDDIFATVYWSSEKLRERRASHERLLDHLRRQGIPIAKPGEARV